MIIEKKISLIGNEVDENYSIGVDIITDDNSVIVYKDGVVFLQYLLKESNYYRYLPKLLKKFKVLYECLGDDKYLAFRKLFLSYCNDLKKYKKEQESDQKTDNKSKNDTYQPFNRPKKLTKEQTDNIVNFFSGKRGEVSKLAKSLNITQPTIRLILSGKYWS